MRFLALRGALLAPVLFGLLTLTACDSNGPDGTGGAGSDLFLLQPTYFSDVNFPEGGRGPIRLLAPTTTELTFSVASSAFDQLPVTTAAQEPGFAEVLTNAGYGLQSLEDVEVLGSARLTLEAPTGATLGFLSRVEVMVSAEGLPDRTIGSDSFLSGTEETISLEEFALLNYMRQPSFSVYLVLNPSQAPSVEGTYRFGFDFDVLFFVYDGNPAPSEVTIERELYLRDALQQEGYDVGDVVSARVTEVALVDGDGASVSSLLDERIDTVRILAGSTETEEVEEVAMLDTFEEDGNSYAARAEVDHDVTAAVRRTGRLRIEGVFDLNEAAAARGEYYETYLEIMIVFEVPVPEGTRSEEEQPRTRELRVPMRVPVSAESSLGS